MKSFLLTLAFFFSASICNVKADVCDSLEIISIGFNPFNLNEIVVYVYNHNQIEIFSYPGFKLVNNQGDTVASETVNYFGISQTSAHKLIVNTGFAGFQAGEVFNGMLLLYISFYDSLVCSFPVSSVLLPETGCTDFIIFSNDYLGSIGQPVNWSVTDESGSIIFSGVHDFSNGGVYFTDSVCLENGCYNLNITAANPLEGILNMGINYHSFYIRTEMQANTGVSSATLDFTVFSCDSTTAINLREEENAICVFPNPAINVLFVDWKVNQKFTALEISDLFGKPVNRKKILSDSLETLDVSAFPAGVYTIHLFSQDDIIVKRFVKTEY